ncbi:MAG: sensor histidine kinase [Culicoidibacterales bacterium]
MKKILGSLFVKYLVIFISVLIVTNILASIAALVLFRDIPFNVIDVSPDLPLRFAARFGIMSLAIGGIFIFLATRVVVKPIAKLSEAAKQVANGNLETMIPQKTRGHDEISELTDNFNLMVSELAKNEYLHKDFVSNVSHEFKTPLASIQGYAELLAMPDLSETKRLEYASVITRQTKRLAKLSTDLLRLSELENEHMLVKKTTFSLDEQIRDAILLLQNEWEQKNLALEIQLEPTQITGDKALLYQVWVNIIGNAIRYTNPDGQIAIQLQRIGEKSYITVQDTGIGISPEQQQRIFERFYRADESRSTGGTGLGLPIVKRIVELHHGEIDVQSLVGIGTEITIVLPASIH